MFRCLLELHMSSILRNNGTSGASRVGKSKDQAANFQPNGQFTNIAPQTLLNVDRDFLASSGSEAHARQATIHLGY
jgi:hypothetical protein